MPAVNLTEADRDTVVAAITQLVTSGRIPIEQFIAAYNRHRSVTKQTPRFAVLDYENGGDLQAVPVALRRAIDDDFFVVLSGTLFERLSEPPAAAGGNGEDPLYTSIRSAMGAAGSSEAAGVMQRVLRIAGQRQVSTLSSIVRAARATALIRARTPDGNATAFGTGFLVAPCLLLTAAHVLERLISNGRALPGSEDLVSIQFHNQLEAGGSWPVTAWLAPDWLVSMSHPNGQDGRLDLTNDAVAAERLDYVLVRLSERVGGVTGVVDVSEPPEPQESSRLTIIGYPGGTDCQFDDHLLTLHNRAASRLHHDVNATSGMSGGPCIDFMGRAVGLHEGAITIAEPNYNRAVHLGAVRRQMRAAGVDPLRGDCGPLLGVHDREVRRAWIAAGEVLCGTTDASRAEWLAKVAAFNPDDPRGGAAVDEFHPIFARNDFLDWVGQGLQPDSPRRLALLSGDSGSGKSFSATILRNRLRSTPHKVVIVPPSVARGPIQDVLAFIVREVGGSPVTTADRVLRPTAGVVRRDLIPTTLEQLATLLRSASRANVQLWVFGDLGDDAALSGDAVQNWTQILIEAEKHAWVRLLVVGLNSHRRGQMRASAAASQQVESREINALTADDFVAWVTRQAEALRLESDEWEVESLRLWDEVVSGLFVAQGRTVMAVAAALEVRALMLQRAPAAEGGNAQ